MSRTIRVLWLSLLATLFCLQPSKSQPVKVIKGKGEATLALMAKQQQSLGVDSQGRIFEGVGRAMDGLDISERRILQSLNSSNSALGMDMCFVCGNIPVLDRYPLEGTEFDEGLTCQDYEYISTTIPANSTDCSRIRQLFSLCCDAAPQYVCEQRVRNQVLQDYDAMATPRVSVLDRIDVSVSLILYIVTDIDVQVGTAEVFVWLTLVWKDPRLAWTVDRDTCAPTVTMRASLDAEKTEIWVPDFDVYNLVQGVHSMPEAAAEVFLDGTVLWARNGAVRSLCQFTGVTRIPFDTLGCQLLFGPWTRKGTEYYNYTLDPINGFLFADFTSKYNEFRLDTEKTTSGAGLDSGLIFFNLFFRRSTKFYVNNIIVPTALLTYLAFGTFLLDLRVGERLSYAVALALVVVAQQIVTSGLLPVSDARLWIDKFINWSFYWIIFCLVESIAVGYIFFLEEYGKKDKQKNETIDQQTAQRSLAPISEDEEHEEGSEEETSRPQPQRLSPPARPRLMKQSSVVVLKRVLMSRLSEPPNQKFLRRLDRICFITTTVSYSLFIIIMFASIRLWKDNVEETWSSSD